MVVEVIAGRDLVPTSRVAQGPGMVSKADGSSGKDAEIVDGRDCFAETYLGKQRGPPPCECVAAMWQCGDVHFDGVMWQWWRSGDACTDLLYVSMHRGSNARLC